MKGASQDIAPFCFQPWGGEDRTAYSAVVRIQMTITAMPITLARRSCALARLFGRRVRAVVPNIRRPTHRGLNLQCGFTLRWRRLDVRPGIVICFVGQIVILIHRLFVDIHHVGLR